MFQCLAIEKKFQTYTINIDQLILRNQDQTFFDKLSPEPQMILVRNIELIKEEQHLDFLLKGIDKVLENAKTKEIFLQTLKPHEVHSRIMERVTSPIFFDFPSLKGIKLMLTNEIVKVESQYRSMEFEVSSGKTSDDDDQEEDEDEEEVKK